MKNRVFITILNLALPVFLSSFCVPLMALETMPNLDISFHIENSAKNLKRAGASTYAKAGVALSAAEDMQDRIDTMLQIRHTAERTVSQAEYITFVCHAVQTSARATMGEIITILDTIASSITYWQQQQGHQVSYFFHKNPTKWVTGRGQKAEIRQHLDALYALQKTYFSHLGTIAEHLQTVSSVCATPHEQQPSMQRIAQAMSNVVGVATTSEGVVTADLLVDNTVKALYQVPLYVKRANRDIRPHTVPLWATRHWLPVGVAAIMAGGAYMAHNHVVDTTTAWDASWQKTRTSLAANIIKKASLFDDASKKIEEERAKLNTKLENAIAAAQNGVKDSLDYAIQVDTEALAKLDKELEKIKEPFNAYSAVGLGLNMTFSTINKYIQALVPLVVQKTLHGHIVDFQTREDLKKIQERIKKTGAAYNIFAKNAAAIGPNPAITGNDERVKPIHDMLRTGKTLVINQGSALIKHLDAVNRGVGSFGRYIVPALVITGTSIWGMKKLYSAYYASPDYKKVMNALNQMQGVLNTNQHAATLSVDHLGALIYHIYTLQQADIPGELRDQFSADVIELASAGYTREQKMRTIDRMYRSYDFLAVKS